jgi:hypothetical protein
MTKIEIAELLAAHIGRPVDSVYFRQLMRKTKEDIENQLDWITAPGTKAEKLAAGLRPEMWQYNRVVLHDGQTFPAVSRR